jgi:hypothetical protein
MPIEMRKARDFVYANGTLWERVLFAYLFQDGPLDRVHRCLLCYKNSDGGWGHALEHDLRCPDSHPLALEFLLRLISHTGLPVGALLEDTSQWLERKREADGSLNNPDAVLDYPHAPWWNEGGQTMPDSIVGNLTALGLCSPSLAESTRRWVETNLTLGKIRANEWLFMAYHAYDYFMNVDDFPDVATYRRATVENIIACAEKAPENQYYSLFTFAPTPDSPVAKAAPAGLLDRFLDYLEQAQEDDGHWNDEHGLQQWYPYATITILLTLRRYGRAS